MLRLTAILLLIAASCSAQDCLTRKLPINISDDQMRRVASGVSTASFAGRFHGKNIEFSELAKAPAQPRVILLVDTSGSMRLGPEGDNAALGTILEQLFIFMPKDVRVSVGFFGTEVSNLTDFRQDHTELREIVRNKVKEQKKFTGLTAIADAIDVAMKKFGTPQSGDSLLIVTDAEDNTSKSLGKKLKRIQKAGIRLFLVMLDNMTEDYGPSGMPIGPSNATKDSFAELSETTGGTDWRIRRSANVNRPAILRGIAMLSERTVSRFNTGWQLTIRLPEEPKEPEKLKLKLGGPDRKLRKFRLEYPQFVFPCATSTSAAAAQP